MNRARTEIAAQAGKVHVVTKADVGIDAPYIIGVFLNPVDAAEACRGPGTFTIFRLDPNRVYPKGSLLDCAVIDHVTAASIAARP